MSFLVDTNICIAILNGKDKRLIEKLKTHTPEDFVLCSPVKAELLYGARKSKKVQENIKLLESFFAQFESINFDDRAAEFYGTIRAILTQAGTPIGANDYMIASIALANDLTVLTRNRDEFTRVPGLKVEVW